MNIRLVELGLKGEGERLMSFLPVGYHKPAACRAASLTRTDRETRTEKNFQKRASSFRHAALTGPSNLLHRAYRLEAGPSPCLTSL